jgi:hypothetical protein
MTTTREPLPALISSPVKLRDRLAALLRGRRRPPQVVVLIATTRGVRGVPVPASAVR